ncbi:MAG: periplasmic heavy metal sensor [Pseudomonadota bacterium]
MSEPVRYGGCPLWARILLLGSLTVNLVILGLVIGERLRPKASQEASWMISIVPDEKRESAQELFSKRRSKILELRKRRQELRRTMMLSVKAETFEADAMAAQLETHRTIANEQRALIHAQLIELFGMLSHEERLEAANRMQTYFSRRRGRPE